MLLGLIGALAFRCFHIHIFKGKELRRLAAAQHLVKSPLPARRGNIIDRNGDPLAVTVSSYSAWADPELIPVAARPVVAAETAKILGLSRSEVLSKISKGGRFVYLKRQVGNLEAAKVRNTDLPGVFLLKSSIRNYPHGRLASTLLGFCDIDNNGLEGVEAAYDRILKGVDGYEIVRRDGKRRPFYSYDSVLVPAKDGSDVMLTIDSTIQAITEEEIAKARDKHNPECVMAVVMNPDGQILAMANLPDYDCRRPGDFSPDSRRNRCITDVYEPGSSFKPFIAGIALEKGIVKPETTFFCGNGSMTFGKRTLRDTHGYGVLDVRHIIIKSSNIGMAQIGFKCGSDLLHQKLSSFGFGTPTGVEIPGEVGGILRPRKVWSDYSIGSVSMGQEIACTCLQLARGFAIFASNGMLVNPRIIVSGRGIEGTRQAGEDALEGIQSARVMSEKAVGQIREMLSAVVTEGTAQQAKMPGYQIGGKTGTSQLLDPSGKGYSHSAFVATFAAIAPVESPALVVVVSVRHPRKGGYYGGVVAAPVVREIVWRSLAYMRVQPSMAAMASADDVMETKQ